MTAQTANAGASTWQRFQHTIANALIVARREMRDSFRDWRIMAPIFLLTLVFPSLAQGMTRIFTNFFISNGAAPMIDNFLPLLPMIVGFFPVSISLVIALETFVGEKERRSLEPLLSTPLTNAELYIGKTLAATVPPLAASYVGMGIYIGGLVLGEQQWRPPAELIIQIMLLTTAQALVMVTGAVVVSSQTTSTRASNLLASFIIIPTSLLVMFESFVMITNRREVLWYVLSGLFIADIMLFNMGSRIFNREELLGRAIDQINLRWAWRLFWKQMRGGAQGGKGLPGVLTFVRSWYQHSVFPTVRSLRTPMLFVALCLVLAVAGGFTIGAVRTDLQLPTTPGLTHAQMVANFQDLYSLGNGPLGVQFVAGQNLRVLIGGALIGVFTFGVMSIFFSLLSFGILGYLISQPALSVLGAGSFIMTLIPHSIFEIPAVIICTAAATRLGAIITRPPEGKGVWEAWVEAFADLLKVLIALVVPLLLIAAVIEVYITPRLVLLVMGQ